MPLTRLCCLPNQLNCHHLVALGFGLFPTLDKFKAAIHRCSQDLELQNTMGSFSSVQEDTDKYSDGFQWVKRGFVVLFTFRAGICAVAVPASTMVTGLSRISDEMGRMTSSDHQLSLKPTNLYTAGIKSIYCEPRSYFLWRMSLVCAEEQLFIRIKFLGGTVPWPSQPGKWPCDALQEKEQKLHSWFKKRTKPTKMKRSSLQRDFFS